jgi:hypothetical protein
MNKVVYLPLDERPCNAKYPVQLAAITDLALAAPPAALLGRKKQPARYEAIAEWLLRETADADDLIVSVDMLVYGGIVPSRLHRLSEPQCAERLRLLDDLKRRNPSMRIHAYSLIMRAPAYNSSDEEPDYYEQHGYSIFRYGWLRDKREFEPLHAAEQAEWDAIQRGVPDEVLRDFLDRRTVNASINRLAVDMTKAGTVDRLIIPLDDNAEYGFSPMEQRKLLVQVERLNLMDQVFIYPGADEIGCTLFAGVFCRAKRFRPAVQVRYSSTRGPSIIPKYEDRSLNESVKSHLTAGGAFICDTAAESDFVLMVHSPPVSQQDVAESPNLYQGRHRAYYSEVHTAEFVSAIEALADRGAMIALADVASCNGSDHTLMQLLAKRQLFPIIRAYAGWNTSGNTLGTVVAHAIIASYYEKAQHRLEHSDALSRRFMLLRLIEDWGYQTLVRFRVADELPALGGTYFDVSRIHEQAAAMVTDQLRQFVREYLGSYGGDAADTIQADLPWKRMFEVNLTLPPS